MRGGGMEWKKMRFIVATYIFASRPPERRATGMLHAHAKISIWTMESPFSPWVPQNQPCRVHLGVHLGVNEGLRRFPEP